MSCTSFPFQSAIRGLLRCVLAACLTLLLAAPAASQDPEAMLTTPVRVARAVGLQLAGQPLEDGNIALGRNTEPEPSLTQNDFRLAVAATHHVEPDRLEAALIFEDALGRQAHRACIIAYTSGPGGTTTVRSVDTWPYTPPIPTAEVYILDAAQVSLKDLETLAPADLLVFARDNTEVITAEAMDPAPRTYHVLVFAKDRLQSGDAWVLFADSTQGFSWNRDGWGVAGLTASFALNGPEETVFRIFYAPGTENVFAGKVMAAGVFTNRYLPPIPLAPADDAAGTPKLKELRNAYQSKSFPTM